MQRLRRTALQVAGFLSLSFMLAARDAPALQIRQTQENVRHTRSPLRTANRVTVTVTDRKRNYVKGLVQSDFTITDGKQELQINSFSSSDLPLSVGIVFDTSTSVKSERLKSVRDGLQGFFELSNKANEYFLVGFDTRPKLLQEWTSDAGVLLKQLDGVRPEGATALYDACYLALEKMAGGRYQKHAVILVSDGLDNVSTHSFAELKRALEENDTLFYSVGLGGRRASPLNPREPDTASILDEVSSTTGGAVFFPDGPKQLNAIFDMIAIELRNQYLIGFTPASVDGKRHSLRVRVTPPPDALREIQSLSVRSRKSFYAGLTQR
jgi:Ca-activated chloride channel family protein